MQALIYAARVTVCVTQLKLSGKIRAFFFLTAYIEQLYVLLRIISFEYFLTLYLDDDLFLYPDRLTGTCINHCKSPVV